MSKYQLFLDRKAFGLVAGDVPRRGDLVEMTGDRKIFRVVRVIRTIGQSEFREGASHSEKWATVYAEWEPNEDGA